MKILDSPDQLASLIRFHRKQAGLTQIDLGLMADVSRKVIQDLEARGDGVSWRNLSAVLQVLNVRLQPVGPLIDAWIAEMDRKSQAGEEARSEMS